MGSVETARNREPGTIGVVLRQMREARGMTLATVARQAQCSESLVQSVETGQRRLQSWLANRLDQAYGTGHAISVLCAARTERDREEQEGPWRPVDDVILIRLPQGGVTVPLSRRELLAALGLGTVSGTILETLDHGLGAVMRPTNETLNELRRTYDGFLAASRFSTSRQLRDAIVGQIAVTDALRHRAPSAEMRRELTSLMARQAEAVSWLYEESYEVQSSLYWLDRATFWAQTIDWQDMVAFIFYRRSILAMNHANDGSQVIELTRHALHISGQNTLPSVRGAALGKMSQGYALMGQREASAKTMDRSIHYLCQPIDDPDNPAMDDQSVITDNSLAIRQSASLLLLGDSEAPIAILEPRLASIGEGYQRNYNLSCSRLALAYANAGEPERACTLAADTVAGLRRIPSLTAWRDLQRMCSILGNHWPARSDVEDIRVQVRGLQTRGA